MAMKKRGNRNRIRTIISSWVVLLSTEKNKDILGVTQHGCNKQGDYIRIIRVVRE